MNTDACKHVPGIYDTIIGRMRCRAMMENNPSSTAQGALTSEPARFEDSSSPRFQAFVTARTRFAEDQLAMAIERGVRQYVVLGTGLDISQRSPYPASDLKVFAVDSPAAQAWKRKRFEQSNIRAPSQVAFVPTDFEEETLSHALKTFSFDPRQAAFFSWLGVTPYSTPEAVLTTLRFVASLPTGSRIVFDYVAERSSLSPFGQTALDALSSRVATAGEPARLLLEPEALINMLRAMGFRQIEDLGPNEIESRYFKDRRNGFQFPVGSVHLVSARV